MNDTDRDRSDPYPDVRMRPGTALGLTAGLAVIYSVTFMALAMPARAVGLSLYASFGLGAALIMLSYIDMRTGLLLDVITLPLIVAGIGFAVVSDGAWLFSIAGAGIGYALVAALAHLWRARRGYEGIGLGDAKLLAAGGAWVGAALLPMILLIASGLGIAAALIVSQKTQGDGDRAAIPFGPALGLGIWVTWCVGETIFP